MDLKKPIISLFAMHKYFVSSLSKLVQVYRDYAPNIATLNQRLTTTDHLIDQLVYKLYNLTPTEIAIVEGQS